MPRFGVGDNLFSSHPIYRIACYIQYVCIPAKIAKLFWGARPHVDSWTESGSQTRFLSRARFRPNNENTKIIIIKRSKPSVTLWWHLEKAYYPVDLIIHIQCMACLRFMYVGGLMGLSFTGFRESVFCSLWDKDDGRNGKLSYGGLVQNILIIYHNIYTRSPARQLTRPPARPL